MSRYDEASELLPGLLPASFRGVGFHVIDASHEVGRRLLGTWFPGLDGRAWDDFGRLDGPITITAILVGDDYVAQAQALAGALQTPGPGTLVHPWLGEIEVVVPAPARIAFTDTELRVARVEATFERHAPSTGSGGGRAATRGAVATSAAALWQAGTGIVLAASAERVVATYEIALLRDAGAAALDLVDTAWTPLTGLGPAREDALAAVRTALGREPSEEAAIALGTSLAGIGAVLRRAAVPPPPRAIGLARPAPAATASGTAVYVTTGSGPAGGDAPAPRAVAALALALAGDLADLERFGAADAALLLAAEIAVLAAAAEAVAEIAFESRGDAMNWLSRTDGALAAAGLRASALAAVAAGAAMRLWTAVQGARAALATDIHEVIGRLPAVRRVPVPGTVPAWLIAQHLAGDAPDRVVAMLDDLVRRNRLRHPGAVADDVEALL